LAYLKEQTLARHPDYAPTDEALLATKYTPSQLAAIKAAEAAIDPRDLTLQSKKRNDPWRLPYEDDLSHVDGVIDHAEKLHGPPGRRRNAKARQATEAEREAAVALIVNEQLAKIYPDGVPQNPSEQEELRMEEAVNTAVQQAYLDPRTSFWADDAQAWNSLADPRHSAILQELPRIDSKVVQATATFEGQEVVDERKSRLLHQLGWPQDTEMRRKGFAHKAIVQHYVSNYTRLGKIASFYVLTIAGNQNGLLGVGEGKAVDSEEAMSASVNNAYKNMKPIPRYENRTIFGDIEKKLGAVRVQLSARPPGKSISFYPSLHFRIYPNMKLHLGFGLRTNHLIFEIARLAGIKDLAARVPRSRNKMNVVKATWEALTAQKLPEDIARARGKKLVDVRKVYYGGSIG
jgi:small subunit ribosomal protein S5